jgi:hypothetical protein
MWSNCVRLVGEPTAPRSPIFGGLEPHPDGWRAAVRKPNTLPHYPMVLHCMAGFPTAVDDRKLK